MRGEEVRRKIRLEEGVRRLMEVGSVLPAVLARTSKSLWEVGFRRTTIGLKGVSSSCRACQMSEEGRAR